MRIAEIVQRDRCDARAFDEVFVASAQNREPGITVDFRPNGLRRRSTHAQEPFL